MDDQSLSTAFENLLRVTVGIQAVDRATGAMRGVPDAVARAVGAELTTPEDGDPTDPIASEAAEAMRELDAFERRLASGAAEDIPDGARAAAVRGSHRLVTGADAAVVAQPVRRKAPIGVTGLSWSTDAPELVAAIARRRSRGGGASLHTFTTRSFLYGFFERLKLVNMRLRTIDERTASFTKLKELNISGNRISCLENLPPGLQVLQAYGNEISVVRQRAPLPRCVHVGLGFNALEAVGSLAVRAPALVSLDLSWNSLCDLDGTVSALSGLRSSLETLDLFGNPLALTKGYRAVVDRALGRGRGGRLAELDGLALPEEDAAAASSSSAALEEKHEDSAGMGRVELFVEVVGVGGVPAPADVAGWAELEAEEAKRAAAAAGSGGKGKKAKKGSSSAQAKEEQEDAAASDEAASSASRAARLELRAAACPVQDGDTTAAEAAVSALHTAEGDEAVVRAPMAVTSSSSSAGAGESWPSLRLVGSASVPLRDALALHGLSLRLMTVQAPATDSHDDETATAAAPEPPASLEEETVLGEATAACAGLLEASDRESTCVTASVPLRLLSLPPATREAVLQVQRRRVREEAREAAEAAQAAEEESKGGKGKKPKKKAAGGKAAPVEELEPLSEEQEERARAAAEEECAALSQGAKAEVRVRMTLML